MANDSDNKEVQRSKEFEKRIDTKAKALHIAKKFAESTTEDEFSKLGYEKVEGPAGVYATGKEYGKGAQADRYSIGIEGVTDTSFTKKTQLGAKRMESDINIIYKENHVEMEYKTPEAGFFRGVDKDKIPFTFNTQIIVKIEDLKESNKELKDFFKNAANKEIGYLENTKLGVEDKLSKSTTSTVNENTMEKLTLKSLFSDDKNINEGKEEKETKGDNTIPMKDVTPHSDKDKNKDLFFDEKKEEKSKTIEERDEELKEITTSGPAITGSIGGFKDGAPSGAGGYNTPFAFKNTNYAKNKRNKRPKIDENYNIVKENRVDDFNPLKETKGNGDGFWQVVKIDPETHPLGLPGVKPNSAEELRINSGGMDKDKMRRMGLKESELPDRKIDLTKKKIFSEEENKIKGINKRYLITEKTSDEYLKERWEKLSVFKINESIVEAEESTSIFKEIEDEHNNPINLDVTSSEIRDKEDEKFAKQFDPNKDIKDLSNRSLNENYKGQDNVGKMKDTVLNEETVEVDKPGSLFGISYKFYKKDFLSEGSKYILDLNSRVFVPNPNAK